MEGGRRMRRTGLGCPRMPSMGRGVSSNHTTPRMRLRRLYGPSRAMGMCSDGYVRERERERVRRRGSILTIRHLLLGVYERASEGR